MPNSADNKCVHTLGVPLHPPPNLDARVRIVILSGILFLSGIGALIFETLWLGLSGLAFGGHASARNSTGFNCGRASPAGHRGSNSAVGEREGPRVKQSRRFLAIDLSLLLEWQRGQSRGARRRQRSLNQERLVR